MLELAKIEFDLQLKENLPTLAADSLEEGIDTPSLRILAGLDGRGDNLDLDFYLNKAMDELHILRPNKLDSAWLLIEHYIDRTVEKEIDPHEGIHTIIWSVYHNMDWYHETKEYVGDAIGIQELDGLCDSFDDLAAASKPWSTIKTNTQLLEELKEEIVAAAERYKINYLAQRGAAVDRQKAGSH